MNINHYATVWSKSIRKAMCKSEKIKSPEPLTLHTIMSKVRIYGQTPSTFTHAY